MKKICTFGQKIMIFKKWFSKYEQKTQVDSNLWCAVHKPDILTTELQWYSTNSIYTNNFKNKTFKSLSFDVGSSKV